MTDLEMIAALDAEDAAAEALDKAHSAFRAYVASLSVDIRDTVEAIAMENTFSAECHGEYADDLERWNVALRTADMAVDQKWYLD